MDQIYTKWFASLAALVVNSSAWSGQIDKKLAPTQANKQNSCKLSGLRMRWNNQLVIVRFHCSVISIYYANLLFQIKLNSNITSVTKGETKTYYKQLHEDQPSSLRR